MEKIKERIIEYFNTKSFVASSFIELSNYFVDVDAQMLKEALDQLESDFVIRQTKKGKYDLLVKGNLGVGTIEVKEKGFGFIKDLNSDTSFYVDKVDVKGAFSGDTVLFAKYKFIDFEDGDKPEAKVVEILKRGLTKVIGTIYTTKKGKLGFRANLPNILFEITNFGKARSGDQVIVSIEKYAPKDLVYGRVEKIIGKADDKDALYRELAFKYDFNFEFPDEVLEEASKLKFAKDNREFIDSTIFTIDGDDAKDFDDAVSIKKLDNGNYYLGVYIADVAYYVKEDSAIDKEAFARGTSVYLPNHVIPMLPEVLSNDLCSLRENEEKQVIACLMEIDNLGNVVSYEIKKATIKSKHRMTYNKVNAILDGNEALIKEYSDIYEDLLLMDELKDILHEKRNRRGSLDFEANESVIIFDNDEVSDVVIKSRGKGENLIEEYMLIANETVASHIYHMDLPFIYRIHEEPPLTNYKRLVELLNNLGIKVNANLHHISNFDLQKVLEATKTNPAMQNLVLRLMCKAKYSPNNIGHFGLASPIYCHFTSPIRRYPDLIVHRLIHKYLFENKMDLEFLNYASNIVSKASIVSSKKEKDAISFEYEACDKVIARYYEKLVGYEFNGVITSVVSYGLFVTLDNLTEGLVHISHLPGFYVYDQAHSALVETGIHHRKYVLGQKVKVVVNAVSTATGQIDFIIVK